MKNRLTLLLLVFLYNLTFGQNCNCIENFDFLKEKVENDYAGFADKVNDNTINDYRKHSEKFREKAIKTTTTQRCVLIMEEWLKFFNDKHLQLSITSNIYRTFKSIDSTSILFRIPSFSYNSKPLIDSLIRTNYELIRKTPILIIDLRGNGGGIDYSFLELLPLIYTHPYESKGVGYWASKGNIEYFEKALEEGNIRKGREEETKELIAALKSNENTFVNTRKNDLVKRDSIFEFPKKVGIIVNDFCASSCEQFVLACKNSEKSTVFGTNTLGVLDYSNSVPSKLPISNVELYYPMTRSNRLPDFPIDNIGIEPDVRINLHDNLNIKDDVDEWVIFVKEYLENELIK